MPFIVPSFKKLRNDLLRDIKNLKPDAHISEDSDYFVRASSIASCVEGLYQHQAWIVKQIFPDTADTEYLEKHCSLRRIFRKSATNAVGTARIAGEPNTIVPSGLIIRLPDGKTFETIDSTVIGNDGSASVVVKAIAMGIGGNVESVSGMFVQTPVGIQGRVDEITTVGGVENETDKELLARLLERIRRPPAGGNQYDYRVWALEVEGVTNAYVYPLRRGLGTVDVVIVAGDSLASEETVAAAQKYINDMRPVTAKSSLVLSPTIKTQDISLSVHLRGVTLQQFQSDFEASVKTFFDNIEPGKGIIRSQIEALASNVPGVVDRVLHVPVTNIDATVNEHSVEWIRMGALTVEVMT
ncbi:baseplate J/gp47 family protein [Oligella urethralis]|uniref:baseplate J/gp47 family protein n=1 Tax=Oligella urethralis TaxID=90245 RepID=UPI002889D8F2|nr:baseplate J/gp47 family protein [Oligella urethralis]